MDDQTQDLWLADEAQAESLISGTSSRSRSEFDNFTSETAKGKKRTGPPSISNGKAPIKTPGILRTGDASLLRNGQPTLPAEKAFAIQIGWRLFRLSGASIMSDGEPITRFNMSGTSLKSLERPPISPPISRNKCDWQNRVRVN